MKREQLLELVDVIAKQFNLTAKEHNYILSLSDSKIESVIKDCIKQLDDADVRAFSEEQLSWLTELGYTGGNPYLMDDSLTFEEACLWALFDGVTDEQCSLSDAFHRAKMFYEANPSGEYDEAKMKELFDKIIMTLADERVGFINLLPDEMYEINISEKIN